MSKKLIHTAMRMTTNYDRLLLLLLIPAIAAVFISCDLDVFDPGTVEDVDLNQPRAIIPLLAGVEGDFAVATTAAGVPGGIFTAGSMLTDELVHSGQWIGIQEWNEARIDYGTAESQTRWLQGSRARWVAEDAVRRISKIVDNPGANTYVAQAAMWAGFANRVMGDHFCQAVINGGPLEPYSVFHQRGEEYFTQAIEIAGAAGEEQYLHAAYAGRAQVRMMLGNWSGAADDAGNVPTNFIHVQRHSDNSSREHNGLYVQHHEDAQSTVWGTPFAQWGTDTANLQSTEGDPRVSYQSHASRLGGDNRRPLWRVMKYSGRSDNVVIARGTEMRLIEAEAALINNQIGPAINLINEVRDHHGIDHVSAENINEAWEILQKERGLELWLEGRRLPDIRRWAENPGSVPFEVVRETAFGPASRDEPKNVLEVGVENLCIPVSRNEVLSNPNIN